MDSSVPADLQKSVSESGYLEYKNCANLFGFINIYKPQGLTSHDVVAKLRKITGIKQIGHTGTLDPFAEGVLPVCIGKATRLIEYLKDDKEYLATVQLGMSTTTYDKDGETVFTSDKKIFEKDVVMALENFRGEILQTPPVYSAIKVKGKKLYEYARKGEAIEVQPRRVTIEKIELKSFNFDLQQAEILIKCTKGTYIRSIAQDLGQVLECGAHLRKLIRTQAGSFRIEDSIELRDDMNVSDNLINPVEILDYPRYLVSNKELEKIRHGMPLINKNIEHGSIVILVYNKNEICAVGMAENNRIKLKKVFL